MKEKRIFGPPGTGKTTYITRQIREALKEYKPNEILIASFTKSAAVELVGRNRVLKDYIGTLHSHCYKIIGEPEIIKDEHIKEFNKKNPALKLSIKSSSKNDYINDLSIDKKSMRTEGDKLFFEYQLNRALMIPESRYSLKVKMFKKAWEKFKFMNDLIDFTDMIEKALDVDRVPNNAKIGFFDEAQDFTPLEFKVIRQWGEKMDQIIFSGDDDQLLYAWTGARAESFINGEAEIEILDQSYRVPEEVQRYAERWIRRIRNRQEKIYKPKNKKGSVKKRSYTINNPRRLVQALKSDLSEDKEVMVLTTCDYMLKDIIKELKLKGIPFKNEYRIKNNQWNPVKTDGPFGDICSFLRPLDSCWSYNRLYTIEELISWTKYLKSSKVLKHGAKTKMKNTYEEKKKFLADNKSNVFNYDPILKREYLEKIFKDLSFLDMDKKGMIKWFKENILSSRKRQLDFSLELIKNNEVKEGYIDVNITVGTIHSVKGGEADKVYLFPDLSAAGMKNMSRTGIDRDSILKTFYVGMTRSKESLILCSGASHYKIKWL